MKFELEIRYPASFQKTQEMFQDEDFYTTRAETIGVGLENIDLICRAGRIQASSTAGVSSGEAPAKVRRFIPETMQVSIVEAWGPAGAGSRPGSLSVSVSGVPVMVSATSNLIDEGECTIRKIAGEIRVKIPFVGKMIEEKVAGQLGRASKFEESAAERYLGR